MTTRRKIKLQPVWAIELDTKKLGKSIYTGFFNVLDGDMGTALKGVVESVGVKEELGRKAYLLVFNALFRSVQRLVDKDHKKQWAAIVGKNWSVKMGGLKAEVVEQLKSEEVAIYNTFFTHPKRLSLLMPFKQLWKQWLQEELGLEEGDSHQLALQLPSVFVQELYEEFDEGDYKGLHQYFQDNVFDEVREREQRLQQYYHKIEAYYHQPALGDQKIKLSDIYIRPLFKVYRANLPNKGNF